MVGTEDFDHQYSQNDFDTSVTTASNQVDAMYSNNMWSYDWAQQCDTSKPPDLESPSLDGPWTTYDQYTGFDDGYFSWSNRSMNPLVEFACSSYTTETPVSSVGLSSNHSSPTTLYQLSPAAHGNHYQASPSVSQRAKPYSGTPVQLQPFAAKESGKSCRPSNMAAADDDVASERASRHLSRDKETDKQRDESVNLPDGDHDRGPRRGSRRRKIQKRNREAATKFRTRKREDAVKLQIDEEDLEDQHRQLFASARSLSREVHDLKMQLLQHSDCDCTLIQDYIRSEAQRYVHGTDTGTSFSM